jgi:hypothetical protein
MPKRERDRELARRRKRREKKRKLHAKGPSEISAASGKESEKKKPEKGSVKEAPPGVAEKPPAES